MFPSAGAAASELTSPLDEAKSSTPEESHSSSRGVIPQAKIRTVKMTLVIVCGGWGGVGWGGVGWGGVGQGRAEQGRAGQGKSRQGRERQGHGKAGQGRVEQGRAGWGRMCGARVTAKTLGWRHCAGFGDQIQGVVPTGATLHNVA